MRRLLLSSLALSLLLSSCDFEDYDDDDDSAPVADADGDGFDSTEAGGADCDDSDPEIYPGADEVCDGVDNDCDGEVDGPASLDATLWYSDGDGDGYGASGTGELACEPPEGAVDNDSDCDDSSAALTPADSDGDGMTSCDGDCDDADERVYPGAFDLGVEDLNCDGIRAGELSAGPEHICGIHKGAVRCYGRDQSGQVSGAPTGSAFVQVASGGQFNTPDNHSCALGSNGAVTCWGSDDRGQSSGAPSSGSFVQVGVGNLYSCALEAGGSISCWGESTDGQTEPPLGVEFESFSVGGFHACGTDTSGLVHCWGWDGFEQSSQPHGRQADKVVCGEYHTCILSEGTVECWGYESAGQDPPGPTSNGFVDLVAGGYHNCAQDTEGALTCWGWNAEGQLDAPTGLDFGALTAHADVTCGTGADGFSRCWGANDYGQGPTCLGSLWPDEEAPSTLADIGLFSDVAAATLTPGVTSFEPQYTLWSDGSVKSRWVYLPECSVIDNSDPDIWVLPIGTRLFKQFDVDGGAVETRMIQRTQANPEDPSDDGIIFAAYLWDAAGESASLWDPVLGAPDAAAHSSGVTHDVPSRANCVTCHGGSGTTGHPSRALGFSGVQLSWSGSEVSMESLSAEGWLTDPHPEGIPTPGDPTTQAALGTLHANCGNCHNDLGEGFPIDFDLWLGASDETVQDTGAWLTAVDVETAVFPGAEYRIVSGDAASSAVIIRMSHRAPEAIGFEYPQMPPLGTKIIDPTGLAAVEAWINSL